MKTNNSSTKTYRIKVLDVKYKSDFNFLDFKYIHYKIKAESEDEAIKEARKMYMKGQEGERVEEFPFLLKIFSVDTPATTSI